MIKLSRRLQAIADFVHTGAKLADIGTDHALLPVYLVQQGRIPGAIAGDINPGPVEAARKQVAEAGLSGRIEVRRGDGLAVLKEGEADTITIAGMGGALIAHILENGKPVLGGVKQLVLQPNVGEPIVREWLLANGWALMAEHILEEDGKLYEIVAAERRTDADAWNGALFADEPEAGLRGSRTGKLMFGPYLSRTPPEAFRKKWSQELAKLEHILRQLAGSELPSSRHRELEIRQEIAMIKEALTWE